METIRRRKFIQSTGITSAAIGLDILSTKMAIAGKPTTLPPLSSLSDDELNPFQTAQDSDPEILFYMVMQPGAADQIVGRLTSRYKKTRNHKYLEWAMMYGFVQWRMLPRGDRRARVAKIHQKLAAVSRKNHSQQPAGYVWGAMFTGLEILTYGIMNSLNRVPAFEKQLIDAERLHADYYFGLASLLRGKILVKAPPFPVSSGDIRKGIKYIERAGNTMRGVFGPWYIIYAEAMYLSGRPEQSAAALKELRTECQPVDFGTDFLFHMSLLDATAFENAISDGSYDRYLFDPLLTPIEGIERRPLKG